MDYLKINVNKGDNGYPWRLQTGRTMDQLDQLIQHQLRYRNKVGEDKAKVIENDIDSFADAEQFRYYHAVGRFRSIFSAMAFTAVFFTMIRGPGQSGRGIMKANPLMTAGVFGGSLVTFYQVWIRVAGYNSQKYNEF